MDLSNEKIAFLGCGNMGGAIAKALTAVVPAQNIYVSAKHFENAQSFANQTGTIAVQTNKQAVISAKYIFVSVKPVFFKQVLDEVSEYLTENHVVISMAAGLSLESLKAMLPDSVKTVIRIMPNMPAKIGQGMTAMCYDSEVDENIAQTVKTMLLSSGKVEIVAERLMDCVTAVSGSGPAFVFMFIEAFADAAVRFGMPRAQAYTYASQTLLGSAAMCLETGLNPSVLKDQVCSPAGTTIEGVTALEKHGLRNAVIEAVSAAYNKSVLMGKK